MSEVLINLSNVVISGILTGLVYGLMALGLSVIFGVARVVNFAHGEMMTARHVRRRVLFAALEARSLCHRGAGRGGLLCFRLPVATER